MEQLEISANLKPILDYRFIINKSLELPKFSLNELKSVETIEKSFLVDVDGRQIAISYWIGSKRSRTYPFPRLYDILQEKNIKKIALIPIVKDEGPPDENGKHKGERDYLAWSTFTMCSFLNVYLIPTFHVKATQSTRYANKVTNHDVDRTYVIEKIKEISKTTKSPKEWNGEQRQNLGSIVGAALDGYERIRAETGIPIDIPTIAKKLETRKNGEDFKNDSQQASLQARCTEVKTAEQQRERLFELLKCPIDLIHDTKEVIFWAPDGYIQKNDCVYLVESKNSRNMPSMSQIKDALLKIILYCGIKEAKTQNKKTIHTHPVLLLSSEQLSVEEMKNKCSSEFLDECKQNRITLVLAGQKSTTDNVIKQIVSK